VVNNDKNHDDRGQRISMYLWLNMGRRRGKQGKSSKPPSLSLGGQRNEIHVGSRKKKKTTPLYMLSATSRTPSRGRCYRSVRYHDPILNSCRILVMPIFSALFSSFS
jgi:hypothetical protein